MPKFSDLVLGIGEGALSTLEQRRKERLEQLQKLQQLQEAARLEQAGAVERLQLESRLKQQAEEATPERTAQRRALELITGQASQQPPTLRLSSNATPEMRMVMEQKLRNRVRDFESSRAGQAAELEGLMRLLKGGQAGGVTQVFGINPSTEEVKPLGTVPRGSRTVLTGEQPVVIVDPVTGEQRQAGTVARGARVIAPTIPMEKTSAVISAQSALRSINEMRDLVVDPSALLTRGVPGIEGARKLDRLMRNLELEIVTARGGKQLTPSERQLIRQVFPNRLDALDAMLRDDPSVIEAKLQELEQKAQELIGAVSPSGKSSASGRIRVRRKDDGRTGTIDAADFDPGRYERL